MMKTNDTLSETVNRVKRQNMERGMWCHPFSRCSLSWAANSFN